MLIFEGCPLQNAHFWCRNGPPNGPPKRRKILSGMQKVSCHLYRKLDGDQNSPKIAFGGHFGFISGPKTNPKTNPACKTNLKALLESDAKPKHLLYRKLETGSRKTSYGYPPGLLSWDANNNSPENRHPRRHASSHKHKYANTHKRQYV